MKFQGFVGPAYTLKSKNVDCQRCVNLYPEIIESGSGKEGGLAYLKSTPGLNELFSIVEATVSGPVRLIHCDNLGDGTKSNKLFAVIGNKVVRFSYSAGAWSYTILTISIGAGTGNLGTSTGPVSAASIRRYSGATTIYDTVFVDGDKNYLYEETSAGSGYTMGDFGSYGYPSVLGATHVVWIDGYLIYNLKNTDKFYVSDLNSPSVDPLSYSTSEGNPDSINALLALNRYLWCFGERSIELFVNTGSADFPFERVSGGFIESGCAAGFSVAKIDRTVLWLGKDDFGKGIVYAAKDLSPQRVSNHAIEYAISTYADISSARAYTYQEGGHNFYVLNFAEATWVYDLSTGLWHERAYTNQGVLERHRADTCAFYPDLGINIVGDYSTKKIYKLDEDKYTDNGAEITRMRIAPHISNGMKRVFYDSFQLDLEVGVGLDGASTTQGSDPQIMMQYSDDGGHTWSSERWGAMGKIGEYRKRAIWRRLGNSRDRLFKVKITDPVKVILLGAELGATVGAA